MRVHTSARKYRRLVALTVLLTTLVAGCTHDGPQGVFWIPFIIGVAILLAPGSAE